MTNHNAGIRHHYVAKLPGLGGGGTGISEVDASSTSNTTIYKRNECAGFDLWRGHGHCQREPLAPPNRP